MSEINTGTLLAFLSRRLILQSHCIKPKGLHKTQRSMRPRSLQVSRMKKEEEQEREERERERDRERGVRSKIDGPERRAKKNLLARWAAVFRNSGSSSSSSSSSSNSVSGTIAGGSSSSRMRTDNRDESSVTDGTRSDISVYSSIHLSIHPSIHLSSFNDPVDWNGDLIGITEIPAESRPLEYPIPDLRTIVSGRDKKFY
ncbi:hypothetical protein V1478_011510, partial [Vespula squamosa]